jgi:prolyl-tRNA editing enzyme YbaK/EbsC (Cys-tRNA(Pro) deacylase)
MTEDLLARPAVQRVRDALREKAARHDVIALTETARTAQDAANALGCEVGAIVKSLVFAVGGKPVMALVAGDRMGDTEALPGVLGLDGRCKRADADMVREATGFTIGGVAPVGHATSLPIAIDESLGRFDAIYAAAGHPHCVFQTTLAELQRLTGGAVSSAVSKL